MNFLSPNSVDQGHSEKARGTRADAALATISGLDPSRACLEVGSTLQGLSVSEAEARLKSVEPNVISRERKASIAEELWGRARNPLNALLLSLSAVSFFLGDLRAAIVIAGMVILAVVTAFIQEHRSNESAAKLRAMVHKRSSHISVVVNQNLSRRILGYGTISVRGTGEGIENLNRIADPLRLRNAISVR
jgi:magnesium-transporting ATPase (P-type)